MCISAMISSIVRPWPSCSPTWRLRLCGLMQVAIRSPMPARPEKVSARPPIATPSRVISARPRVITAERVLSPTPRPSPMPDGDRDHVLERAAELAADHVAVGVDAEQPGVEDALQLRAR